MNDKMAVFVRSLWIERERRGENKGRWRERERERQGVQMKVSQKLCLAEKDP